MRLECKPNFLEIFKNYIAPKDSERPGDTRLEVKFQAYGFIGANTCWVEEWALNAFSSDALEMFNHFKGSAELESISPEEFRVSLSIANPRGYVLVKVTLGHLEPWCSVGGSFEIPLQDVFEFAQWAKSDSLDE